MKVRFHRGARLAQYSVHIHRPDGVVVSLPGAEAGGRSRTIWRTLLPSGRWGLPAGLGSAASGAMFDDMAVVSGRLWDDPSVVPRKSCVPTPRPG